MSTEEGVALKESTTLASRKAIVAERWKLLRDALRGKPVSRQATFKGYEMITSRRLRHDKDDLFIASLKAKLQTIVLSESVTKGEDVQTALTDVLETSLLGLLAVVDDEGSTMDVVNGVLHKQFTFSMSMCPNDDIPKFVDLKQISMDLRRRCEFNFCSLQWGGIDGDVRRLELSLTRSNKNRSLIQRYELTKPENYLLVRERSSEQVISLQELTSHHGENSIDNTGNVCVWDCEKTLLWAILSFPSNDNFNRVLELGAGMAGLVGLGLAAVQRATNVVITDGNPGSLQSNRTHVRLMEASPCPLQCTVDLRLLPWALNANEEGDTFRELQLHPANLSVVSDCTHFERYHGHLLWTLIQCTAVDGQIWMCHPDRGASLERFLDTVKVLTEFDDKNYSGRRSLLRLEEMSFSLLDEKHVQMEKEDPHYRPNVHRPRIFRMWKLREATEEDRSIILRHLSKRDS